jgi:hypothetical protein
LCCSRKTRLGRCCCGLLDHYYPASVFDGSSGDAGPEYDVALRKALERIKAE